MTEGDNNMTTTTKFYIKPITFREHLLEQRLETELLGELADVIDSIRAQLDNTNAELRTRIAREIDRAVDELLNELMAEQSTTPAMSLTYARQVEAVPVEVESRPDSNATVSPTPLFIDSTRAALLRDIMTGARRSTAKVLSALSVTVPQSRADISEATGLSSGSVKRAIRELRAKGLLSDSIGVLGGGTPMYVTARPISVAPNTQESVAFERFVGLTALQSQAIGCFTDIRTEIHISDFNSVGVSREVVESLVLHGYLNPFGSNWYELTDEGERLHAFLEKV